MIGADTRPASTARVLHAAIVASVVLWAAGYLLLRMLAPLHAPARAEAGPALRGVFFAVIGVVTFLAVRARRQLQAPRLVADADVFWRDRRGPIYAAWVAAELGAFAGVVLAWLTGVTFMAVALPAVALLALGLAAPGALRSR